MSLWAGCPHPAGFHMRLPHIVSFFQSPLYFFTACTCQRQPLLANQQAWEILSEIWRKSAALDGWCVGRFVLMPDHVHFFAMPTLGAKRRAVWHKMWKSVTARRLAEARKLRAPIWQPDTFEHLLRSTESYSQKWEYVRNNPVRAGLSRTPDEWPWQGEIGPLQFLSGG